jgi:hypothetical protein
VLDFTHLSREHFFTFQIQGELVFISQVNGALWRSSLWFSIHWYDILWSYSPPILSFLYPLLPFSSFDTLKIFKWFYYDLSRHAQNELRSYSLPAPTFFPSHFPLDHSPNSIPLMFTPVSSSDIASGYERKHAVF